jgi:hypothetical protein
MIKQLYSPWVRIYHKLNPRMDMDQLQMMYEQKILSVGRIAELYCAHLESGGLHESISTKGSDFVAVKNGRTYKYEVKGGTFCDIARSGGRPGVDHKVTIKTGKKNKDADFWMMLLVSDRHDKVFLFKSTNASLAKLDNDKVTDISFVFSSCLDGKNSASWYAHHLTELDI